MKKLLVLGIILISVFLIYLTTIDKKVYYLALGDSLACGVTPYNGYDYGYTDYVKDYLENKKILETYVNEFAVSGYRSTDLYRDIIDNKQVKVDNKSVTLKNALIKADLVTISIGANDLFGKSSAYSLMNENENEIYKYIDEIMIDVENLFKLMREYCKEDIILVGYYNPVISNINEEKADKIFDYVNKSYDELSKKYDIYYVEVYEEFKGNFDYLPNPYNIHPSKQGYKAIADLVIEKINQTLLQ